MGLSLYEIANEYRAVLHDINEAEDIEMALQKLGSIEKTMQDKAIAVGSFIKNLEAERKAIEEAKKAMAEREERLEKKVSAMTDYLQFNMEKCGITEINSSPYFAIKLKKCPPSVDIYNEDLIPEEFKYVKTHILIDKARLKEELKNGVVVEGATLRQNVRLEIK